MVLSGSGVASIIVSKHRDSVLLELVNYNDDSNIDVSITTVSKRNVNETRLVEMDKKQYETQLQRQLKTV